MNKLKKLKSLFKMTIGLLISTHSFAGTLSPEAMYYRCYAHMTRTRPASTDARLLAVKAGTLNYVDACMQVFDLGALNSSTGKLVTETTESIKVLENFHRFHTSWFDDVNVFNALIPGGENMNHFLHDGQEPALHFTRAVFHPDGQFKDAVTSNSTYQAIRSKGFLNATTGAASTYGIYPTTSKRTDNWGSTDSVVRVGGSSTTDLSIKTILDPNNTNNGLHIQMGKITGIAPMENISIVGATYNTTAWNGTLYSSSNQVSITKSFGGGLLGTQPYIMINRVRNLGAVEDGGLMSGRVYGKQFFKEILCRDIPVVQQKDVISLVDSTGTNPFPFRNGSSCMQCHASIDTVGWTLRDLRLNRTGASGAGNFLNVLYFVDQFKGTPAAQEAGTIFGLGAPNASDANFYKRPAKGHFYFRTHEGKLISQEVQGLSELGQVVSDTDDYYMCATKRYFEFFTGHKVYLDDSTDANARILNDKESKLRKFVVSLGKTLHQNQKIREIVKSIISSDYYKTSDYEINYK
jgi:hypothetical protein